MRIEIENVRENDETAELANLLRAALFPSDEDSDEIPNPFGRIDLIERYGSEIVAFFESGRAVRIFVTESIPVVER